MRRLLLIAVTVLLCVGCLNSNDVERAPNTKLDRDGGSTFVDAGTSDAGIDEGKTDGGGGPAYPPGPYGYQAGSTIENCALVGWHDSNDDGSLLDEEAADLRLSDYFANETVDAIVVVVAAEWCAPCNALMPKLVELDDAYKRTTDNVAFLVGLVQDNSYRPADASTFKRWATKHRIAFDLAIDPSESLGKYYDVKALPFAMVIRRSDMSIRMALNGARESEIAEAVDGVISPQ